MPKCLSKPSLVTPAGMYITPALHIKISRRLCVNSAQAFLTDARDSMSIFTKVTPTEGVEL